MKKSLGRKTIILVGIMGLFLVLAIFLNLSAWNIMSDFNAKIADYVHEYEALVHNNDLQGLAELENSIEYELEHSIIKIDGTVAFDYILLGVSVVFMVLVIIIVHVSIAKPAKSAGAHMNRIVGKIEENRGDLTERIEVKTKDEIA